MAINLGPSDAEDASLEIELVIERKVGNEWQHLASAICRAGDPENPPNLEISGDIVSPELIVRWRAVPRTRAVEIDVVDEIVTE